MEQRTLEKKLAELEALLFIHGEPASVHKIQKILGLVPKETEEVLAALRTELRSSDRGLSLVTLGERVQLVTKPEFGKLLQEFVKEEMAEELTLASLEALAIISYLGPVSRSRLEYLRGVNSTFILRSLLLRGLVERFLDPKHPNSYLYVPSFELLKHLGVGKVEELPEFEKFQSLIKISELDAQAAQTQNEKPEISQSQIDA